MDLCKRHIEKEKKFTLKWGSILNFKMNPKSIGLNNSISEMYTPPGEWAPYLYLHIFSHRSTHPIHPDNLSGHCRAGSGRCRCLIGDTVLPG